MENITKKTYGSTAFPEGWVMIDTYRGLMEHRIKTKPDVALFRCRDHFTDQERVVMPAEFKDQVDALSSWLADKGYKRTHIAILGENSYQWVLTMFAVICSDNILVTLDKGLEYATMDSIFGRSDSTVLFYSAEYEDKAKKLEEHFGSQLYKLEEVDDFVSAGRGITGHENITTDPDAMAVLMYTSGTTGPAKGVMLSQRNIMGNLSMSVQRPDLVGDTIYLLPLNHIYGLGPALLIHFLTGSTNTINLNLRFMKKDILEAKPEILIVVPLFVEMLYASLWKGIKAAGMEEKIQAVIAHNRKAGNVTPAAKREMFKEVLAGFGGRLSRIVSGGAPLNMKHFDGFMDFGIEVMNGYGITEGAPVLAVNPIAKNKPASTGLMVAGEEIKIDSPDENGDGEICVKGPNVMLGYYKDEEETAKTLKDGWLYTGDKGFLDEDNYVYVNGRIKNLIILNNGENVSPEELEGMLCNCPAIFESVVYENDETICVQIFRNEEYITSNNIEDPDTMIRNFISDMNRELATYKRINVVQFRDEPFEHTTSKKIKRSSAS